MRYVAHGGAATGLFSRLRLNFQQRFTAALRRKLRRGHVEVLRQRQCNGLCAAIRPRKILALCVTASM
ncbi:hypothetical protein OAN307_c32750 [Octadecabacter antarcticus 307]|uniref:Uncharacterized protein n=1 Tax=Octadecabacter antarcticus 307 TaxID=391626 RepID=M9R9A4_9RHOB|nr:hypothetical protein OAN307_c32750 [Octadecabacter antarcticus 307]